MLEDLYDFYMTYIMGFGWWFTEWFIDATESSIGAVASVLLLALAIPIWFPLALAGLLSIIPVALIGLALAVIVSPIAIPWSIIKKVKESSKK